MKIDKIDIYFQISVRREQSCSRSYFILVSNLRTDYLI